MMLITKAKV